jgi:pimeloyl-ACP methyl ester carboxylesterase
MLPTRHYGDQGPLIVLLHWLGGSALTWNEVCEGLAARGFHCVALDLPGFGHGVDIPGYTKREMAAAVIATIQTLRQQDPTSPWLIAGHSMGGAVATLVTRAAEDKHAGLENLSGIVLASPSTPGPEPMPETTRTKMLTALGQSTGDAAEDRKRAEKFVDDNTGKVPLQPTIRTRTIADVLRMNRAAFTAWLEHGSKEDHASEIGILAPPALILAGSEEPSLGPDVQQQKTAPHFLSAGVVSIEGAGHLSPLERPAELVALITNFAQHLGLVLHQPTAALTPEFLSILDGPLTSPATRDVLHARLQADAEFHQPLSMPQPLFDTLRALTACVIPTPGFDLAARLDRTLADKTNDGWRFDTLPADAEAWRIGLASLNAAALHHHNVAFIALHPDQQHALLGQAQQGKLGRSVLATLDPTDKTFSASQMQQWFEDVRGQLTRLYVADPRTLQRIGFTGFADEAGFTNITLNETATTGPTA